MSAPWLLTIGERTGQLQPGLYERMVASYARLQELDRQLAEESRAEAKTRHVEEHALRFEVRLATHQ